jgi:hypothetical protein
MPKVKLGLRNMPIAVKAELATRIVAAMSRAKNTPIIINSVLAVNII